MKNSEIWIDVKGYEGLYQVSNLGNVKRLDGIIVTKRFVVKPKLGKILNLTIKDNGYLSAMFSNKNNKKRFYVHRLVGLAFLENPENKKTINHINGVKTDNRLENLEWCTYSENLNHAIFSKLRKSGHEVYNCKLSKEKIIAIRRLYSINKKFNKLKLSKKLGISDGTIHRIIRNKTYKQLEYQYSKVSGIKKSEL